MTKSKVGAEPKKERIKRVFAKSEGIHEGANRDECGYFESNYHPYCFAYGYFFHRGKSLATKLTKDYIKDNWDREGWYTGLSSSCMAVIDRKRKIAVVKIGTEYDYSIERAIPHGYTIYEVIDNIPVWDITSYKNRKILIRLQVKKLIIDWLNTYFAEYHVLTTISKVYHYSEYSISNRNNIRNKILDIVSSNKWLSIRKPIQLGNLFIENKKFTELALNTIIQQNLLTDEERTKVIKCRFYAEYCRYRDISWKELDKNWSDEWRAKTIKNDEADAKRFRRLAKSYIELSRKHESEAKAKVNSKINNWRNYDIKDNYIKWQDYYIKEAERQIVPITRRQYICFETTQLRLIKNRPNWIETSRGAVVPLEKAINLFNMLYTDYILSDKTHIKFCSNKLRVGNYILTEMQYCNKYIDGDYTKKSIGYKEWKFQIGCHTLWFDDIKDFAKYYNLQDRLNFPLNIDTAQCMRDHIVHLSSGINIQSVGMSGVLDK